MWKSVLFFIKLMLMLKINCIIFTIHVYILPEKNIGFNTHMTSSDNRAAAVEAAKHEAAFHPAFDIFIKQCPPSTIQVT